MLWRAGESSRAVEGSTPCRWRGLDRAGGARLPRRIRDCVVNWSCCQDGMGVGVLGVLDQLEFIQGLLGKLERRELL